MSRAGGWHGPSIVQQCQRAWHRKSQDRVVVVACDDVSCPQQPGEIQATLPITHLPRVEREVRPSGFYRIAQFLGITVQEVKAGFLIQGVEAGPDPG